jgi:hypothetical protein
MICVYALVPSGTRQGRLRGLRGERLRRIGHGPVTAIAGELPGTPRPSTGNLRRYDAVVRGLAARLPAVLPVRFATCVATTDELLAILDSRRREFQRALAHVRGRVQMTVRVVGADEAGRASEAGSARRDSVDPPGPPARRASPAPRAPSGAAYLRARADAIAREERISGFDPVREAVRRWVRDERVEKRAGIASVYHLIPRASAEAYRATLTRAAADARLGVLLTGPWPVYAFTRPL